MNFGPAHTPNRKFDLLLENHPLKTIDKIIKSHPRGESLEFGFESFNFEPGDYDVDKDPTYVFHDDAGFTGHEILNRTNDFADFFHNAISKERDVTITSDVRLICEGFKLEKFYLPQIDFSYPVMHGPLDSKTAGKLPMGPGEMDFYASGRSMHAYGLRLMNHEEWLKFLGNVLMMNKSNAITDQLWVGYSLVRGYTALRLTSTNEKYLQLPSLIANPYMVAEDPREPLTDLTGCDV